MQPRDPHFHGGFLVLPNDSTKSVGHEHMVLNRCVRHRKRMDVFWIGPYVIVYLNKHARRSSEATVQALRRES